MPVIRRWRREMIMEEPEEFIGAEMYPYLSEKDIIEDDHPAPPLAQHDPSTPHPLPEKEQTNKKIWTRLWTIFQYENW